MALPVLEDFTLGLLKFAPWVLKIFFDFFFILLNRALSEKSGSNPATFSFLEGVTLGPWQAWSPTSEVISPALQQNSEEKCFSNYFISWKGRHSSSGCCSFSSKQKTQRSVPRTKTHKYWWQNRVVSDSVKACQFIMKQGNIEVAKQTIGNVTASTAHQITHIWRIFMLLKLWIGMELYTYTTVVEIPHIWFLDRYICSIILE